MSDRIVNITWEGPFDTRVLDAEPRPLVLSKSGLYQIYGHHVVFGPGSMLYIGMVAGGERTFCVRLAEHMQRWLRLENEVHLRFGYVAGTLPNGVTLADVEALTIWWHSPPYNSSKIWTRPTAEFRVRNTGAVGRLHHEYSVWPDETQVPPSDPD